jgi:hypothetical protein
MDNVTQIPSQWIKRQVRGRTSFERENWLGGKIIVRQRRSYENGRGPDGKPLTKWVHHEEDWVGFKFDISKAFDTAEEAMRDIDRREKREDALSKALGLGHAEFARVWDALEREK